MAFVRSLRTAIAGAAALASTRPALAEPGGIRPASLSASGSAAYPTHKSDLADSNDTGMDLRYRVAVAGGSENQIGAELRSSLLRTTFARAARTAEFSSRDFLFLYRFWYLHAGASMGTGAFKASAGKLSDAIDATYNSFGGVLGFTAPIYQGTKLACEAAGAKAAGVREATKLAVTAGMRLEAECAASFAVSRRLLDANFGFRYSSFAVTGPGAGGTESLTAPFVGLSIQLLGGP